MLLLFNLLISALLTGLIWTIQLVHYPAFALVGKAEQPLFQLHHEQRISYLVIPLMLTELAITVWLLISSPEKLLTWLIAGLLAFIWLVTALVFVPLHNRLKQEGYILPLTHKLINWNWPRTLAWTVKTALLCWLLFSTIN